MKQNSFTHPYTRGYCKLLSSANCTYSKLSVDSCKGIVKGKSATRSSFSFDCIPLHSTTPEGSPSAPGGGSSE